MISLSLSRLTIGGRCILCFSRSSNRIYVVRCPEIHSFTHLSKDSDDVMSEYDANDYAAVATLLGKQMILIPMTQMLNTD